MSAEIVPYRVRRPGRAQAARAARALEAWSRRLADYRRRPDAWHRGPLVREVREFLRSAQEDTLFHAERFHAAGVQWSDLRTLEDLRHFPILERRDLQERYEDLLSFRLTLQDRNDGLVWRTSGTTGQPVSFFLDGESHAFPLAMLRALGGGPGRPGSCSVVFLCTLPRSLVYAARLPHFGATTFRKLHLDEPGAAATLARLSPRVVTGDPDSLGRLDGLLARGDVRLRPRLVLSSAFAWPEEQARSIQARTGARAVDCYSIAETGPLAVRCGPGRPFHVLGPACHLETDPDGEILVTNLRNRFFPLVRYRTGDLGEIRWTACDCGYLGPSVTDLEGRRATRFRTFDGREADPSRLEAVLSRLPVAQFQLVQTSPDRATLRWHGTTDIGPLRDLERALGALVGGSATVRSARQARPLWRSGEKPMPYSRM